MDLFARQCRDRLLEERAIDIFARTLWGEAKNESLSVIQAIANVIKNRFDIAKARNGFWWGNSIIEICKNPEQFCCWRKGNAAVQHQMMNVTTKDKCFATAKRVASLTMRSKGKNIAQNADHYYKIGTEMPWAHHHIPILQVKEYLFYRLVNSA